MVLKFSDEDIWRFLFFFALQSKMDDWNSFWRKIHFDQLAYYSLELIFSIQESFYGEIIWVHGTFFILFYLNLFYRHVGLFSALAKCRCWFSTLATIQFAYVLRELHWDLTLTLSIHRKSEWHSSTLVLYYVQLSHHLICALSSNRPASESSSWNHC